MVLIIRVTNHEIYHYIVKIYYNFFFIIKLFLNKEIFIEKLAQKSKNNLKTTNIYLFYYEIFEFINGIFFQNYIY